MDKLRMMSMDRVDENIEKIQKLFPNAVTEVLRDGKLTLAIDFDVLKQELSKDLIDDKEERYQFTWPDKKKSILLANSPISATLRPCKEESVDFDNTQNLYIEGDNLDVLKLLQETYLGKVKMIYIDPPYNTGNDFVYNDDFTQSADEYADVSGQYDDQGNRLVQNTESNGRFHTDWLNMIYPRLKVAKDLLSDDGVIFISIDDNELSNLRKVCDEIFGSSNFICTFIWEKTQHFGRQKLNNYSNADFVLCYANNLISEKLKELLVESINCELLDAPLYNASNNVNVLTFPVGSVKFNMKDGLYTESTSHDYELLTPVTVRDGRNSNEFSLRFRSRWSNQTVQEEIKKGTTFWVKTTTFAIRAIYGDGKTTTVAPKQIIFTNTSNPMATKNRFGTRIDTSENATNQLNSQMGAAVFSYPKPVSLIKYFISMLYNERKGQFENDFIVLDFFSGSGTMAQALMELNYEDNGKRKFICVQLPENLDDNFKKATNLVSKDVAKNAIEMCDELGVSHYLTEVAKERIRRAGKMIKDGSLVKKKLLQDVTRFSTQQLFIDESKTMQDDIVVKAQDLDIGFRVLKLDSSNMKDVYYKPADYSQGFLESLEDNIKPDRTPLDLLFQVMLELGKPLSAKIEEKDIAGKHVFAVDGNDLVACFDNNVTEDVVKTIAQMQPLYAVFRDSSLSSDSVAANFDQIFATYSPNTTRKVL
ncbi:MAG: site-specific DNA-methyltransferase [Christensenellales bacterium]